MTNPCTCDITIDNDVCSCSVVSSDGITVGGRGTEANKFTFTPDLDPDEDNLITCAADGLLLELPLVLRVPPQAAAYNSANISIVDDTNTIVTLDSEYYDTDTMHSTVTNTERLTIVTTGVYRFTFRCSWAGNVTGDRWAYIRRNGREIMGGSARKALNSASFELGQQVVIVEFFEAGEYVHAEVKQDSTAALNLLGNRYSPILTAKWMRGTPYD